MVLLGSAADARNIIAVSTSLDLHTVLAIGLPRRWIGMVGSYGLGILYGGAVLGWTERKLPVAGRIGRWFERVYARWPRAMLLLWPAYATSFFAGSTRLPMKAYAPPMIVGQIAFVIGAYYLGSAADTWIDRIVDFFRAHLLESTVAFSVAVVLQQLVAHWRRRRRAATD